MRDSYDTLIEAQRADSMESLKVEDVLAALHQEEPFDVSSRLWERLAFLIYQDSDFGLVPPTPSAQNVLSIINRLCKSSIIRASVDGETFVGTSDSPDCPSNSQERIIYATLVSSSKEDLPSLLSQFSTSYPSSAFFAQKLLNNDDRFLTSLLVLLPFAESLPSDSPFHPVSVFLEAMHLISYDCGVLIDWLNSELAASSVILRVLKSCCNPKTAKLWENYVPKKLGVDQIGTVTKWREQLVPCDSPPVTLKIIEIVGDQEMTKTLKFSEKKCEKIKYSGQKTLPNSGSFCRWIETVKELRTRLRRLHHAKLVAQKYGLILKWTDNFITIHSQK